MSTTMRPITTRPIMARALPLGLVIASALSLTGCGELDTALRVVETVSKPAPVKSDAVRKDKAGSSVKIVQTDRNGDVLVTEDVTSKRGTRTISRNHGGNSVVVRQTQR